MGWRERTEEKLVSAAATFRVFTGKDRKRRKQKKERFSCCTSSAELRLKLCMWRFWLVEEIPAMNVLVIHH